AAGALISFTPDRAAYPLVAAFFEGVEAARCQSPLSADGAENIAITGAGIFNGSGEAWRPMKKGKITDSEWKKLVASGGVLTDDKTGWYPSASALKGAEESNIGKLTDGKTVADFTAIHDFLRPNMLRFTRCQNILLAGVHIENSPAWTLHLLMCDQVTLQNLTVKNPAYGQNTDGVDLESCRNVHLTGCSFDVGDDGICIKSGRDAEGRKRNMPTENVVVENCTVYHAHGGFVIGSEMSGGARNLYVSNCNFIGTDVGLRFKTTRGRGGVVENIHAADIYMKDIAGEAILFDMYYMAKDPVPLAGEKREMPVIETLPVNAGTPVFRNFDIRNIVCIGAEKGIFIRGIPESQVQQINFSHLVLQTRQAIECTEAWNVQFNDIRLLSRENNPLVYIQNSKELQFNKVRSLQPVTLFFSLNGDRCSRIRVSEADWNNVQQKAAYNFGAIPSSIDMQ
ncbi:MAG TPA: glycoside hydrolase family 28 protein, partial [Sediminibacterium sp.]|nr:glycoside hydrolase family 28 protein [Sediminibacterium sp.]